MTKPPDRLDQPGTLEVNSLFGPMVAFENDLITDQLQKFGAHTRNEVALLRSFVCEGDLIYDIGAHIGTFAIPLAISAGVRGRVIAVEAESRNFSLLWKNLCANDLCERVAAVHALAGGEDGPYSAQTVAKNSSATYFVPDPDGELRVVCGLDQLHHCFGGARRAAMVKIDVEGMELSVLRSGKAMIANDKPVLYVETAIEQLARYGTSLPMLEAFLRPLGYCFFRNVGERNSTHDAFELTELNSLADGGVFYDLLALTSGDPRLARIVTRQTSRRS